MRSSQRDGLQQGDNLGDDVCVVFLHIPKTAGRTFRSTLALNYPRSQTIHLNTLDRQLDDEMKKIPLENRSNARLLWGHMPYGADGHMPQRCEYVTILREPIQRAISVYKYILRAPSHVLHGPVMEGKIDLEEYVESGMDEGQTENSQTRQLSGRQFGPLSLDALADAQNNLEGFLVAGLTERFEETFVLLRRALRLRLPLYITRNVSAPLEVSARAVDLIRARNELDLELYRFAQNLFIRRVATQPSSFGFEASVFRALRPLARAGGSGEGLLKKASRTTLARRLLR
jgi:hypothetical protein